MKNVYAPLVLAAGASAVAFPRSDKCCFSLTASGGISGSLGQLSDGQNRVGGSLPAGQYCLSNGAIYDNAGRGCLLTPETSQFQCDQGKPSTPVFSVSSSGLLQHNGDSSWTACPTGLNGEYNIYVTAPAGQGGCVSLTLSTGGQCTGSQSSSSSAAASTSQVATSSHVAPSSSYMTSSVYSAPPTSHAASSSSQASPSAYSAPSSHAASSSPVVGPSSYAVASSYSAPASSSHAAPSSSHVASSYSAPVPTSHAAPSSSAAHTSSAPAPSVSTYYTTVFHTVTSCSAHPTLSASTPCAASSTTVLTSSYPVVYSATTHSMVHSASPSTSCSTSSSAHVATHVSSSSSSPTPITSVSSAPIPLHSSSSSSLVSAYSSSSSAHSVASHVSSSHAVSGSAQASTTSAHSSSSSATACQTGLSGAYQTPELIIPVNSASPDTAYGTVYSPSINSENSTIFNFNVPSSYSGKTCSVIFLWPTQSELETSSYTTSGSGGCSFEKMSAVATSSTTYDSMGSGSVIGSISSASAGNSYVAWTGSCAAGTTESIMMSATGGLSLTFFEDWNPSPIGVFMTAC